MLQVLFIIPTFFYCQQYFCENNEDKKNKTIFIAFNLDL